MNSLRPSEFLKVNQLLESVPFNSLFAQSVARHHVDGTIYVDSTESPKSCLIAHPYGMSLLIGDPNNSEFNNWLRGYLLNTVHDRKDEEWLQAWPDQWNDSIGDLLGNRLAFADDIVEGSTIDQVVQYTRINFRFNKDLYMERRDDPTRLGLAYGMMDLPLFDSFPGSVLPHHFWNNWDDFHRLSVGFTLEKDGEPLSLSFASFRHDHQLEIGVETKPEHRQKGYARFACMVLIDYCLDKGLEPVWSCRLQNTGSFKLAESLGFEPSLEMPYYRLVC